MSSSNNVNTISALAALIRAGTHSFKLSDHDKPYVIAVDNETKEEKNLRTLLCNANFVLARSLGTKFPSFAISHIEPSKVQLEGVAALPVQQRVAETNNTIYEDLLTIRDHFQRCPPATSTPIKEYCRLFRPVANVNYAHLIGIDLPLFQEKFELYGDPYLADESGSAISVSPAKMNRLYARGSLVNAIVRLEFERFSDGKLAMRYYVTSGRLVRKTSYTPMQLAAMTLDE